jgi:hypothetical protein
MTCTTNTTLPPERAPESPRTRKPRKKRWVRKKERIDFYFERPLPGESCDEYRARMESLLNEQMDEYLFSLTEFGGRDELVEEVLDEVMEFAADDAGWVQPSEEPRRDSQ